MFKTMTKLIILALGILVMKRKRYYWPYEDI